MFDSSYLFSITNILNDNMWYMFLCVPKAALSYLQLLVGSEDFDIRVFREDELVFEMAENEVTVCK